MTFYRNKAQTGSRLSTLSILGKNEVHTYIIVHTQIIYIHVHVRTFIHYTHIHAYAHIHAYTRYLLPEVGSSRNITLGMVSSWSAITSLLFCPPLRPGPTEPPTSVF